MSLPGWAQARTAAHGAAVALPAVTVPLADAVGATLAEPMRAVVPVPGFDLAAMDGYAVAGTGPWQVSRTVLAGHGDPGELRSGEAVEVATGAPVPRGSEAVLPYEDACASEGQLRGAVPAGRHVRRTGEDVPLGAELLEAGTVITPAAAGLAASVGLDAVAVRRRPTVVALLTGDELVHSGRPQAGQVRDAIGPQLPAVLAWFGAELLLRVPVPDQPAGGLATALESAEADVILSCGATASGPADHLHTALARLGARWVVDGVACRPGHPQSLAVLPDGRYVAGVPGNPFAALVALHTLVQPLLAGLVGQPLRRLPRSRLAGEIAPSALDTRLVAARWAGDTLVPTGRDRPGSLWGAATADVLAVVPPDWAGHPVEFIRLAGSAG